jgi:LacI family transcriptional regulator
MMGETREDKGHEERNATKTTVYSIAKELGISPSTVSRVLNNSSLISDTKRALILSTAERLNYQKRHIKRQGLRAIITIRLFLPAAKYSYIHLFYDVADLIDGVNSGFGETKINIITSINDGDLSLFDSKKLGDIDGCIFAFTVPSAELEGRLKERDIPFVLLNRESPENNYVMVDGFGGMGKLVDALYSKRGKALKPCYIGFAPLPGVSKRREDGFVAACRTKSIPVGSDDLYVIETIAELTDTVLAEIARKGYNALVCFNDLVAISVYQTASHRCISIPADFSLTGFDNSPILDLMDQRIDTIEFSLQRLGREAGAWLRCRTIERGTQTLQKNLEGEYIPGETI